MYSLKLKIMSIFRRKKSEPKPYEIGELAQAIIDDFESTIDGDGFGWTYKHWGFSVGVYSEKMGLGLTHIWEDDNDIECRKDIQAILVIGTDYGDARIEVNPTENEALRKCMFMMGERFTRLRNEKEQNAISQKIRELREGKK